MNAISTFPLSRLQEHMLLAGIPLDLEARFQGKIGANLRAYVSGSADNTVLAMKPDLRRWFAWCAAFGVDPLAPDAEDVRDFVIDNDIGQKSLSLVRMVANISILLARIVGVANVTREEIVRGELKRIKRERGVKHKQALPLRQFGDVISMDDPAQPFSIESMFNVLEADTSAPACRGKFILSLGGDTGRRKAELCALTWGDISKSGDGTGLVEILRSKTDQDGKGVIRFLSERTMQALQEWKTALTLIGGDTSAGAPLLVSIDMHGNVVRPLSLVGFNQVLRATVKKALELLSADHPELTPERIAELVLGVSGHSFRIGFVQDLVSAGESLVAICVEGDWCDPSMPGRYARMINARTGAAARLNERRRKRLIDHGGSPIA